MRISVELVPRSESAVLADASTVREVMPQANAFNIPDLPRFALRSWNACVVTRAILPDSIPHIRAIDLPPGEEIPMASALLDAGLTEILVIRGDPPHDLSQKVYPNTTEEIIRRFKRYHPAFKVFAAYDPYRRGFRDELDAVASKLDAGADGFFTQPIFDMRLLELSAEMLHGRNVFWGLSPVVGDRSRAYWETTNRIVFPKNFLATLAWNRSFAVSALKLIRDLGADVYFMPIKVSLADYLTGLF